jgi:hypothetical protein
MPPFQGYVSEVNKVELETERNLCREICLLRQVASRQKNAVVPVPAALGKRAHPSQNVIAIFLATKSRLPLHFYYYGR